MKLGKKALSRLYKSIEERVRKDKDFKSYMNSHSRPTSRRDFVGMGVLSGTALMYGPSVLEKIVNSAVAQSSSCSLDIMDDSNPMPHQ